MRDGESPDASPAGVELLRQRRGDQKLSFAELADHIVDFIERHPEATDLLDGFARFLVTVEQLEHAHAVGNGSTLSDAGGDG